jgi:hypothetical protein
MFHPSIMTEEGYDLTVHLTNVIINNSLLTVQVYLNTERICFHAHKII